MEPDSDKELSGLKVAPEQSLEAPNHSADRRLVKKLTWQRLEPLPGMPTSIY